MIKVSLAITLLLSTILVQAKDIEKAPTNAAQPWPVLILLHDIFGLDSFVQREVDRYTEMGFYVVAIDYYNGVKPLDIKDATRRQELGSVESWLSKIQKSVNGLSRNKKLDMTRLGIMGWGLGGTLALKHAIQNDKLRTLVTCYGQPVFEVGDLKKIRAMGLSLFAEKDDQISAKEVSRFKLKINEAHANISVEVLPGAPMRFFDFTRTEYFNPVAAEKGKQLIADFLRKHLSLTQYVK